MNPVPLVLPLNFALAAYAIVSLFLFQIALGTNFQEPSPRNLRFGLRRLFWALTATAVLLGLAAVVS